MQHPLTARQDPVETMEYNRDVMTSTAVETPVNQGKNNGYIQHSEVPGELDSRFQRQNRRSYVEKLGVYNVYVLVVGTVAIFAAMAFLSLLWSGSETAKHGRPTPVLWFNIIERPNWATRVVTIGSVIIRLATSAQMGVFAALVAAWTLETSGTSAEHLALLSVIRTVNNGPQSHIWNVLQSIQTKSKKFYPAIIILAILNVLALQFTSTLLITDFAAVKIVPGSMNQSVFYNLPIQDYGDELNTTTSFDVGSGVDNNMAVPTTYPRFAEFMQANSSHLDTDYADTGEALRAFLPFGSPDTRAILRDYKGPATVMDVRVRCAQPSISITNITFLYQSGTNMPYEILILGNITMKSKIPGITVNVTEDSHAGSFMNTAMARIFAKTTDWRLSYGVVNVGDVNSEYAPLNPSADSSGLWSFLLVNVTGNDWTRVLEAVDYQTGIVGPYDWTERSGGIWSDLKTNNDTLDIGISATVCFASLSSLDLRVHVNSEQDFVEPRNMSWNHDLWKYNTGDVREMLGATNERLSPSERGILSLQDPANWTDTIGDGGSGWVPASIINSLNKIQYRDIRNYYPDIDSMATQGVRPQSASLTPYSEYNSINRAHTTLFQDIIQSTNNPALAFQAMFTTLMQMSYYNALPFFSLNETATVASSSTFTVPARWTSFGIVMGLLVIHAVLVITAVVLFLSKTDHSLLGNAWQAVAQVSSSDTMDTMHHASDMTDLEVKRLLRMNSCEDNDVVLTTGADTGRSQAVYRRGTGES